MLTIAVKEGVEGVALKKAAERFSKEKGVTVRIKELPYSELFMAELKQTGRDDAPSEFDVVMVDDPWMPALLDAGTAAGLYGLKKLEKETYTQDDGLDDFVTSTLGVATFCPHDDPCDDYYGVPYVGNSQLLCYNTKDFQQRSLPRTWEEVKQVSGSMEKGRLAYVTRVGSSNSIVTDFMPILWSYDKGSFPPHLNAESGAFVLNKETNVDQQAVTAFASMAELARKQETSGVSVDDFDVAAFLAEGRASMGIVWSAWAMSLVSVVNGDKGPNEPPSIACSSMPGDQQELGVWLLAIPAKSKMQDRAEEFIKYATSRAQLLIAASQGNPPPRRSILKIKAGQDSSREGEDNHIGAAQCFSEKMTPDEYETCLVRSISRHYGDLFTSQAQSLEHARPRPRTRCWREMERVLGDRLQSLIEGEAGSSESLRQAAEKAFSQARDTINPYIKNCPAAPARTELAEKH
jgi:ABC-type glycerol-3-phosphate transport system substrate-binding protein